METGALIGPRLYSTVPGIFSQDNIKSLDEARDVVRRYADHYNTQTIKQYLAGDRKVRQWVIMAAQGDGAHDHHRRRVEPHDESHAHAGRIPRPRARDADLSAI
jgi:hypothetical protein